MDEVVVVASSASQTASALARRLAARGARVAVLTASRKQLPEIARSLVRAGAPEVLTIPCSLIDANEVSAAAHRIERELGPIDRWINADMTDLRFVCATRAALDCMLPRDHGTIVQVGAPPTVRIYTDALRAELRVGGSHVHLDTVRTYPFRKIGAAVAAAATIVGAVLLRRWSRYVQPTVRR